MSADQLNEDELLATPEVTPENSAQPLHGNQPEVPDATIQDVIQAILSGKDNKTTMNCSNIRLLKTFKTT